MRIRDRIGRPLLYEEVVTELYRIIDEEKINPGDRLPPERELTEELGISRNVLREAFHVLESRGIIVSRQGSGRYLRQLPKSEALHSKQQTISRNLERCSLLEAYEVRQVLEVKAGERIIRNADDADIQELRQTYDRLVERFQNSGSTVGEFEIHRLYARKTGSRFMEETLGLVLAAIQDMMSTTFHDVMITHTTEDELLQHRAIIDAIQRRDTEEAQRLMNEHLQMTIDMLR